MKRIISASAFVLALFAGVFIVSLIAPLFSMSDDIDCELPIADAPPVPVPLKPLSGKVDVEYLGKELKGDHSVLKFRITNGTAEPVSYLGYSPGHILPSIYRNGERINLMHCGTGLENRILPSGNSFTVEQTALIFKTDPKNKSRFRVEYSLTDNSEKTITVSTKEFNIE